MSAIAMIALFVVSPSVAQIQPQQPKSPSSGIWGGFQVAPSVAVIDSGSGPMLQVSVLYKISSFVAFGLAGTFGDYQNRVGADVYVAPINDGTYYLAAVAGLMVSTKNAIRPRTQNPFSRVGIVADRRLNQLMDLILSVDLYHDLRSGRTEVLPINLGFRFKIW